MAADKPLVSFLLFAYNQERYIRDAVRGALAQTYEPLEIILSDDCSPDRTFEIIQEEADAYRGPHKVVLNRNEKNLGLAAHINRVFEMANGQFFVGAAGDDISVPERTELLVNRWLDKSDPVDMVCSYFEDIDTNGNLTNSTYGLTRENVLYLPDISQPVCNWRCGATGACVGYDRKLYDKYGPLDSHIIAEDWVLSFRAWVESGIALIEQPLVKHRTHDQSMFVLHKGIKKEKNRKLRHKRRLQGADERYARAKEWFHAWEIKPKFDHTGIESQFQKWIKLRQIEYSAYHSGRIVGLKLALQAMKYPEGLAAATRIFIRNVLCYH